MKTIYKDEKIKLVDDNKRMCMVLYVEGKRCILYDYTNWYSCVIDMFFYFLQKGVDKELLKRILCNGKFLDYTGLLKTEAEYNEFEQIFDLLERWK